MTEQDKIKYIYGKNPVREAFKIIKSGTLYLKNGINESTITDHKRKALSKNIGITYLDNNSFKKKFNNKAAQGIVLKIDEEYTKQYDEKEFLELIRNDKSKKQTILILDGIEDVGNLGAVLRSALLFDVEYVILPKDNSAPINEVVVKRSAGAASLLNIVYVTNVVRVIEELKKLDYWIYALDMDGENITKVKFNDKKAIIIGSEHKGIRPLVKKKSDVVISIPTNNKLDSLNLAVSAGIVLFVVRGE